MAPLYPFLQKKACDILFLLTSQRRSPVKEANHRSDGLPFGLSNAGTVFSTHDHPFLREFSTRENMPEQ
jgi:hypothetical protein